MWFANANTILRRVGAAVIPPISFIWNLNKTLWNLETRNWDNGTPTPPSGFPSWQDTSDGAAFITALNDYLPVTEGFDPTTVSTFGTLSTSAGNFRDGAVAPNGMIYFAPFNYGKIVKLDPTTNTATDIGTGVGKYTTATLAPNGKIYMMPGSATNIIELDPDTDTFTTFGTVPGGSSKCWGAAVGPDGHIYASSRSDNQIVELDPDTQTITTFTGPTNALYMINGANGKLYASSFSGDTGIWEVDPVAKTSTQIYNNSAGNGCVGVDGNIYWTKFNGGSELIKLDTSTNIVSEVTISGSYAGESAGAATITPDGRITFAGGNISNILYQFDPLTGDWFEFNIGSFPRYAWRGSIMHPNGKLYLTPINTNTFIEIGVTNPTGLDVDYVLSTYINGK